MTAGSAGYLGFYYYAPEEFVAIFNKYASEERYEQFDFAGTFAFLTYVMWASIGLSLFVLLIKGSSKN